MATATESLALEQDAGWNATGQRSDYGCACGHRLRVSGGGRHTVYFEPEDARLADPVMNRCCPACGRGLPGKNQA
jgi:hypothetical protein